MSQLDLLAPAPDRPYTHRERALAGVLAGFRWPGRQTFEKLTRPQRRAALSASRAVLEALEREPD